MNLEIFRDKVRDYRRPTGMSQKALAKAVGLHPTVLSNKLNGTDNSSLTHPEIKRIVLTLAEWGAFTQQAQVTELLELMQLKAGSFSVTEWNAPPLSQLEVLPVEKIVSNPVADVANKLESLPANSVVRHNLPASLNPFVGRAREVTQVRTLLRGGETRLLTLTGPAGIGKTRLALQVANSLLDNFKDGVYFVTLAPISDPALVVSALAGVGGLKESKDVTLLESLKTWLRDKQLLMVLDNFEQVVAAAPLLTELLAAAPELKLMVTSREILRVYAEWEFEVPPLALPAWPDSGPATLETLSQSEAVTLFSQRARAVRADFKLTEANIMAVTEICHYLDGLPLAIELAAARLRVLTPPTLLARLKESFEMPFQLLRSDNRDRAVRQQTLRSAFDWSYNLLNCNEQQLFRQLGVFRGGCSVEAVVAVQTASSSIETTGLQLEALMDKSLLRRTLPLASGLAASEIALRYSLLKTLRDYAQERLQESGELEILRLRHALYYLKLAEEAESQLVGAQQSEWLVRLDYEHDNLRVALAWTLETGQVKISLQLAGALWRFWWVRGYLSEGRRSLEAALAVSYDPTVQADTTLMAVRAKALNGAGNLAQLQGDYDLALTLHDESLFLYKQSGNKQGIATTLSSLGLVAQHQGNYPRAALFFEEGLTIQRELDNKRAIAVSLSNLGLIRQYQQDFQRSTTLFEESLSLKRQLSDKQGIAITLNNLGLTLMYQGEYGRATSLFEESLLLNRQMGHKRNVAYALNNLGLALLYQAQTEQALGLFMESLGLKLELGDKESIAWAIEGLVGVAGRHEQPLLAAQLYGAAEVLREVLGTPLPPAQQALYQPLLNSVRAQLNEAAWLGAWNAGRAMTLEEILKTVRQTFLYGQTEPARLPTNR